MIEHGPFIKTRPPMCFDTISCLLDRAPDPLRDPLLSLYDKFIPVCVYLDEKVGVGERRTGECHYMVFLPVPFHDVVTEVLP